MKYLQETHNTEKVKLDAKDKKILGILSSNARIPLTQLSKKVGLSRDAVNYRVKNFEKKGLIQGYRTVVDISKFNYESYHLFVKLNNPSKSVEGKIIENLIKNPYVRALVKFSGNFDFEVALVAKGVSDLDKVLTRIIKGFSGYMQDYEILTISKSYVAETLPSSFFKNAIERSARKKFQKIDKKDVEILKIISEDSKLPLFEIGDRVNLSADASAYRIKNMINSGTILKFVPVINYISLDYSLHTVLLNVSTLDDEKEKELDRFLLKDKNVLWAVKTIGRFNVLIYLLTKNIEDLQETILDLRSLFPRNINRYESLIAYEEYKYVYFPKDLIKVV